jgi:SH3-like domain-containing protein
MKLSPFVLALPLLLIPGLASAEILSVKSSTASFRDAPHQASKVKFTADQFYPVEVVERKAGWTKVKDFEGDTAWVADKLLGKQGTIVVTADRANVRSKPSTSGEVLFKVERGEVFKIEERGDGGWLKVVDARGDGGWLRGDMTWGDPKAEPKGGSAADAKAEKLDDAKTAEPAAKNAKEPSTDKPVEKKAEPKLALAEPEHLAALCRAYLDVPVRSEAPKAEKKADKPAEKKADKPAEKKAEPKADKPAEKKADVSVAEEQH